jgi:hypothetical protein
MITSSRRGRLRNSDGPPTSFVELLTLLSCPLLLWCTLATSFEQNDLILAVGFVFVAIREDVLARGF